MSSHERLPQLLGALQALREAEMFPPGSKEREELEKMGFYGISTSSYFDEHPNPPPEKGGIGRLNSRRKGSGRPTPQELADRVAREMLASGRTPQEIGQVVARILGFKG
ncbi:MAG: hypothetical protein NZL96_03420 [Patescibacteria group bacterium]|nr:hypothetical protein [Patescibacteria group bacterium]